MGIKAILTEFVDYVRLLELPADTLSDRWRLIMLYALCGFANFGSLGILMAGSPPCGGAPRGDRRARRNRSSRECSPLA